jgi:hypothetical protein
MSRILRLALLAPDIIEAIIGGRPDQAPDAWRGWNDRCLRAGRSSEP